MVFLVAIYSREEIFVEAEKEKTPSQILSQKINLKGGDSYGAANVSEVLERQNGVYVNRYGPPGTHSQLFLRGQNPENVGVYFEGILLNDIYGGSFNLENLPFFLLESVEIYPTSFAAELPGSFSAGALDFRIAQPKERRLWLTSSLHTLQGGTMGAGFQTQEQLHYAEIAGSENRYTYQEDASFYYNQKKEKKVRKNEDFFQGGYTAFLKKSLKEHEITFLADIFLKERGLPGSVGVPTEKVRLANQRGILALKHGIPVGLSFFWQNQIFLNYQNQILKDPLMELATGFRENQRQSLSSGLYSSLQFFQSKIQVRGDVQVTYSHLWQNQEDFASRGEIQLGISKDIRPWEKYTRFLFLARANFLRDFPYLSGEGLKTYRIWQGLQENFLLHLGIFPWDFWKISEKRKVWEVYGATFWGGRFPTIAENYGDGATLLPSSELKKEKSNTYSLGSTFSFFRERIYYFLKLNYFLTKSEELILFVHNSQQTMVATNAGFARIEGLESELSLSYASYFKFTGRYQYLEAVDLGKVYYYHGKYLPYRPRHKAFLSLEGGGRYFRLFGGFDFIGRNFRDRYNSPYFFLKERWRFFAGFVYFPQGNRLEEFSYMLRNIFNESQVDVLGYPLAGRVHEIRYTKVWDGV